MKIKSIRNLAAAVRGRRRDLRLTQAELAKRAGVSRKWVYEFEAGKPTAELQLILRVLDVLGLTLELGDQDDACSTRTLADLSVAIAPVQCASPQPTKRFRL
jgi:HTH-type transcriptional regulator / antitoxin HipB